MVLNRAYVYDKNTYLHRELFVKKDGSLIQEGDLLKNPKLALTFYRIAEDPMSYYKGSLARDIVDDIADYGKRQ